MELNEIKKYLLKSGAQAQISHYVSGNLYYTIGLPDGGIYHFPIPTIENQISYEGEDFYQLSADLGTTTFSDLMKASELIRWISKAYANDEFVQVGPVMAG